MPRECSPPGYDSMTVATFAVGARVLRDPPKVFNPLWQNANHRCRANVEGGRQSAATLNFLNIRATI